MKTALFNTILILTSFLRLSAEEPFVVPELEGAVFQQPWGESNQSHLAVQIPLPKGWHVYANPKGPGTGRPTFLYPSSTDDVLEFSDTRYLPGIKFVAKGDSPENYAWVYENEALFFIPFNAHEINTGEIEVPIHVDYLICSHTTCVPGKMDLSTSVYLSREVDLSENVALFKRLNESTGQPNPAPEESETSSDEAPEEEISWEELNEFLGSLLPQALKADAEVSNIWKAILFGLLAGLILNIMPCVLPVISIKIMSFVQQSGEDPKRVFRLGLTFSAGILFVFGILALLGAFAGKSWGSLFQEQGFIAAMVAVIFLFSLSLFGVFTLLLPSGMTSGSVQHKEGYVDAFFRGTMATLLATPCSGPFLGGTMAWALSQKPIIVFIIFMSVGVGMAMPYVILTSNPKLLKYMPRPGTWMLHFERIMGFVLLATAAYLFNLLMPEYKSLMTGVLVSLGLGAYIFGKMVSFSDSIGKKIRVRLLAVILAALGIWASYSWLHDPNIRYETQFVNKTSWQPFSYTKLFEAADQERMVFVDFTADWCPNCKFVESTVLHSPEIQKLFLENNILLLVADITRNSPKIEALLEKCGSRSIPFLAVFYTGENFLKPRFLRDLYSKEDIQNAVALGKSLSSAL